MITIYEWLDLVGYKITEGYDYMWDCYGKNSAYALECERDDYNTDVIFDKVTRKVREATITDNKNKRIYRLIDGKFYQAFREEAVLRGVDADIVRELTFIDLETPEDFMEKASAIIKGIEYDERIIVPLDMTDEEMLIVMRAAHELDITVNQFVELAITEALKDIQ